MTEISLLFRNCFPLILHFAGRLDRSYAGTKRDALAEYHCELLACVAESDRAFAQMHFSGQHVKKFRGYDPTGKAVHWSGAALFQFGDGKITSLWVLGDLNGLDAVLRANESTT